MSMSKLLSVADNVMFTFTLWFKLFIKSLPYFHVAQKSVMLNEFACLLPRLFIMSVLSWDCVTVGIRAKRSQTANLCLMST